jgi:hypothetical protein
MTTLQLEDQTKQLLQQTIPGAQNDDAKVRALLETEYLRKLSQYRRTDQAMVRKYAMTFDEFVVQRVVQQRGYSWEVESDAMNWETAIGGITTVERVMGSMR